MAKAKDDFLIRVSKTYEKYREREEIWRSLEALMTLLTVIFLGLFAFRPTVRAISELLAEINNKEELSQKMRVKVEQMINAQVNYADIQGKIFLLDQYCPESFQLTQGMVQVMGIAQENKLYVKSISLKGVDFVKGEDLAGSLKEKDAVMGKIGFTLGVKGAFENTKKFLSSFFQLGRAVEIKSYSASVADEETGSQISSQLNGSLLFFKVSQDGEK